MCNKSSHLCMCVSVCGQVSLCVISQLVMSCDSAAPMCWQESNLSAQRHKCTAALFMYPSRIRNMNYLTERYIKVVIEVIVGRRKDSRALKKT